MPSPVTPLRQIGLLLLVLVAVPVGLVAVAELAALSENERLLREVYDRQLETVLAPINQHVWAVTDGWADDLENRLAASPDDQAALDAFLADHPAIESAFVADTAVTQVRFASHPSGLPAEQDALGLRPEQAHRLLADRAAGYRRLLPLPLRTDRPNATVALAFVTSGDAPRVAGFVLNAWKTIEAELVPKLKAAAQESLLFGVAVDGTVRYTILPPAFGALTDPAFDPDDTAKRLLDAADVQERELWVFPGYTLRVRPAGASLAQIAADRRRRSLLLVGLLALALSAGAALLFRTVRRQVDLAEAKAVFVQNVSHELRTPLALIRMYAETLDLGRVPEARRREYVRTIAHESARLTRLVNNILTFSHSESGPQALPAAPFDLNALVEEALVLYDVRLDREGFTVERDLAVNLPPALGDAEATSEAVVNLIDNAVKYGGTARHLGLRTGRDDDAVWVEVTDRGIGIPMREQSRIFDEFYRVPTGTVHDVKGTGLGLALVKRLAEAQGGSVSVQSEVGRGSTFRLTLPAAPVAAPSSEPATPLA